MTVTGIVADATELADARHGVRADLPNLTSATPAPRGLCLTRSGWVATRIHSR